MFENDPEVKDHTYTLYAKAGDEPAKIAVGGESGHVWWGVEHPNGQVGQSHLGCEGKLNALRGTGTIHHEIDERHDGDVVKVSVPITKEQADKLHEITENRVDRSEFSKEFNRQSPGFRFVGSVSGPSKYGVLRDNCATSTFDAAEHAGIDEVEKYRSNVPIHVHRAIKAEQDKTKPNPTMDAPNETHQHSTGFAKKPDADEWTRGSKSSISKDAAPSHKTRSK